MRAAAWALKPGGVDFGVGPIQGDKLIKERLAGLFLGSVIVATVAGARWRLWPNGHPVVRLASGRDLDVDTMANDRVSKGTTLLVLEAMKMEHTLSAPADGTVKSVRYGVGEQVAEGAELVEFEPG